MQTAAATKKEDSKARAVTAAPQAPQSIEENNQENVTDIGMPLYMQRAVSTCGSSPPPVQRKPDLTIGAPNDSYEQEADVVANKVMRMPASPIQQPFDEEREEMTQQPASIQAKSTTPLYIQRLCAKCEEQLQQPAPANVALPGAQRKPNGEHSLSSDHHVARLIQSPSSGSALPDHVRSRVGSVLGSDLNHVRVHDDSNANDAAYAINAKAFTHQNHIYLGRGQSAHDVSLMAHEATHVVQQTGGGAGAVVLQRSPGDDEGGFWSSVGESISSTGETLVGYGRAGVTAVGEGISSAVETGSEAVSNVSGMTRDAIIEILEERAPGALAFFRGLRNFINEGITGGFDGIFSGVAESYQEGGIGGALEYIFVDLAGSALSGIGNFVAGNCIAMVDAANWLLDIGRKLGGEAIVAVTAGATAVANFLNGLWDRYGAAAAEAIRSFVGGIWDSITETISEWWDRLEPLRTAVREAWDWLTGTIMEGMQSLNALLAHVFEWAVAKWDELKEQLRPFMGYVRALAVVLLLMSPLGPFVVAGAAAYGLYRLVQYLWEIWGQPLVAEIRQVVVEEILPRVMSGITFLEEKLEEANQWLLGVANDLVNLGAQLLEAIGVLPILRLAQRAISRIYDMLQQFGERVRAALEQFAASVRQFLRSAYEFLQPILEFLRQELLLGLFGPWAILDDGVWETIKRGTKFAMTVPCIREIAGLMQVPAILDMAAQFRTMMKSAWQVIQNPEPIWDALHDAIEPMVSAVPGAAATILAGAIYPTEPEHRRGVEAYLLPAIEHLQEHWWDELKHMGWTLLWPWDEVAERFPMLLQHGWDAITNLFNLEIGAAIDSFLLMMQDVNSVLGAVWGWFAIAAVLVGGVLGALGVEFTAGASIGAGMAAGWALAEDVGIGLLVAMGAAEMAIIGKSMFDIRFTNEIIEDERQRLEANGRDYQAIANSTFTIAILTALVLLGALAGRLASSIWSKISGRLPSFDALEEFLNRPRGRGAGEHPVGEPIPGEGSAGAVPEAAFTSEPRTVTIGGETHEIAIRRIGNRLQLWLCSGSCAELIYRCEQLLTNLTDDAARASTVRILRSARRIEASLNAEPPRITPERAQQRLGRLGERLDDVAAIEPDVTVNVVNSEEAAATAVTESLRTTTRPYGEMERTLPQGEQANHLNQDAAFRDVIPRDEGAAVSMRGNAFTEPGTPHYEFHSSMEQFWDQYRPGGVYEGELPTCGEYSAAMHDALMGAGYSSSEASALEAAARGNRIAHGLNDTDLVPRIPGRLPQAPP